MALLEKVTQMGKDLSLTEDKLVSFIEKNLPIVAAQEEKDREREEKEKEREERRLEREAEKAKQEAQKQAQENEKAMLEMKIQADKEKVMADQEAMELKVKADQEAMELKVKTEQEAEEKRQLHELEMEKLKSETSLEHSRHESTRLEITNKPKPKMPFFDEKVDEMDSYLERFEWVAEGCNWNRGDWPYHLSQYLRGKATEAYIRLSPTDRKNYTKVNEALLERYNLTQ